MMCYPVQPRDFNLFAKGYGFLYFSKNMGRSTGKNINKKLSIKNGPKLL